MKPVRRHYWSTSASQAGSTLKSHRSCLLVPWRWFTMMDLCQTTEKKIDWVRVTVVCR